MPEAHLITRDMYYHFTDSLLACLVINYQITSTKESTLKVTASCHQREILLVV